MAIKETEGTGSSGLTAIQVANQAKLNALNASINRINQTNAAANKLAAEKVSPVATKPATQATTQKFNTVLSNLGTRENQLATAVTAANQAANPQALTQAQLDEATKADYNRAVAAASIAGVNPPPAPTISSTSQSTNKQEEVDKDTRDAFALLKVEFERYGLGELADVISGYMRSGLTSGEAVLKLRQTPQYLARFAGNTARVKAGLNALSESEYLALENSYTETLKAYGQIGVLGMDTATRRTKMANLIGGDVSPVEFKDRISNVVDRVVNSDPAIKTTLKSFYNIQDEDLVSYFLNPDENLPKLKEKVTSAEIGAAATSQGLKTSRDAAVALAQFGVTKEQAQEGYQAIGAILPTATKLGEIYKDAYTQDIAEQEVFKKLASAQRKRQQLASQEEASFSGSSGVLRSRLATYTSKSTGNQGAF